MDSDVVLEAEKFAKKIHAGQFRKDSITPFSKHLENVVNRLKSIGIVDYEILASGWLHDTIEHTEITFDDIFEKFGRKIAVIVSSLSKEMSLPKKTREIAYVKQLKDSSWDSKIIKLCDISANLSDLKNSQESKSKKIRKIKKMRHYLVVIKKDLIENSRQYPKTITLIESINHNLKKYSQRRVDIKL